jgi:hypothetical protein
MLRRSSIVLAVALLAVAARAEPDPCLPAPVDPSLHALAITLADAGDGFTKTLAPAAGSTFPAVSEDGTTVAALFTDAVDFVGSPVATVVLFRDGKVDASYPLESDLIAPGQAEPPADVAVEAKVVAAINARLAKTRWRALPVADACTDGSLHLADGLRIDYDVDHGRLTSTWRGRSRRLRGAFPAPGSTMEKDLPPTCGGVTGLARGFGSRALGWVVLEPSVQLGGDSCMGKLGVDLAIVVRVR